jgi:uncharacterized protein (TIGR02217 family)
MSWWFARAEEQRRTDQLMRFDPRFWTVNFPRPMMASVVSTGPASLRVDAEFYTGADLAGLIWESEDRHDHPLLRYRTARDYRDVQLAFRWRSGGVVPLDAVNGPTLTIEGRDASGQPRAWYVRLWNYAAGTPNDARISIDFAALSGGFRLPDNADPVWAGDIDRMFISLAPPGFGTPGPLPAPLAGWVELSEITTAGEGAIIAIGDAFLPEHSLRAATGYDDQYHLTPARLLRTIEALGYREWINHYVGMSHQFRLRWDASEARLVADDGGTAPFNTPFLAWHRDLAARAGVLGYRLILGLSYELFDAHCPRGWRQLKADGSPALTGWSPPSGLLSPAVSAAQAYLERCAAALARIAGEAGQPVHFQVGEPWWWTGSDRQPAIYDPAAKSRFTTETGLAPPPPVADSSVQLSDAQRGYFTWAGTLLARSTVAVAAAAKAAVPGATSYLLFYSPQVLGRDADNLALLNMPEGWRAPAFDVFQLEDYDFVTEENGAAAARARGLVDDKLAYPPARQHYFSGFVLNTADRDRWDAIISAAEDARTRGVPQVFLWAMPQIMRDGLTYFEGADMANAFDDVLFPLSLGLDAAAEPAFTTQVVTTASGREQRNSSWADARCKYELGSGLRAETELRELLAFFRARGGRARAFRFRDPIDSSSAAGGGEPSAFDQPIGIGDGLRTRFPLTKSYGGGAPRRITRPVPGSVRLSVGGAERASGWTLQPGGIVQLETPPPAGAAVAAGFRFDVPARFDSDSLPLSLAAVRAGQMPPVALIEVRED